MLLCKRFKALLKRISGGEMKGSNTATNGKGKENKKKKKRKKGKSALFSESKVI